MYLRLVHLFTTTTARTVEVKAIAVSSRPINLNFRVIEVLHLQQFLELIYFTLNYLKSMLNVISSFLDLHSVSVLYFRSTHAARPLMPAARYMEERWNGDRYCYRESHAWAGEPSL